MIKVLRLTRHKLTEEQRTELIRVAQKLVGNSDEVDIIEHSETLPTDTRKAVARFDQLAIGYGADVVEAVLPVNIMEAILKYSQADVPIIRAAMTRQLQDDGTVTWSFDHYERIIKVEVIVQEL